MNFRHILFSLGVFAGLLAGQNPQGKASTKAAPTGSAVLSIASGFPPQPNVPNPLALKPYVLLRDSFAVTLAKGGLKVAAGDSPFSVLDNACRKRTPDCQRSVEALNAANAAGAKADFDGKATLPGVPPGTYYVMVTTQINYKAVYWDLKVDLKAGANSVILDQRNAAPSN